MESSWTTLKIGPYKFFKQSYLFYGKIYFEKHKSIETLIALFWIFQRMNGCVFSWYYNMHNSSTSSTCLIYTVILGVIRVIDVWVLVVLRFASEVIWDKIHWRAMFSNISFHLKEFCSHVDSIQRNDSNYFILTVTLKMLQKISDQIFLWLFGTGDLLPGSATSWYFKDLRVCEVICIYCF